MDHEANRPLRYMLNVLCNLLVIVLAYFFNVPNPMILMLILVTCFTYMDGYAGGALSATVSALYSLYYFMPEKSHPFLYDSLSIQRIVVMILALILILYIVGNLKQKSVRYLRETEQISDSLHNVLNHMNAQILVTEKDTNRILFSNYKVNEDYGVNETPGDEPCWRVYHGLDSHCKGCPIDRVFENPDEPVDWEQYLEDRNQWVRCRDSAIEWPNGEKVHLHQAVDISSERKAQEVLSERMHQQELMSELSSSFISGEDVDVLIFNALKSTGEFMEIDRVILSKFRGEEDEVENIAVWSRDENESPDSTVMTTERNAYVRRSFSADGLEVVFCGNTMSDPVFRRIFGEGISGIMIVPVNLDGSLWGSLNLEVCCEPREAKPSDEHLAKMVANLISSVLQRERTRDELIAAKKRAEESAQAKARFLANMSHEIRTPLNAVIGMAELAKSSDDSERVRYCLGKIDDAADHLLMVINDILDMSKIDEGRLELYWADFPLEDMLQRISSVTFFNAEQKLQELVICVDRDVPAGIVADQQRLTQVLTNLLSNAVKFTPTKGKIVLNVKKLSYENDLVTLLFEVTDTGIGISEEAQRRLFMPFTQADNSISRQYGGTGLGLAISKNIIKMMGGEMNVESSPAGGSKFYFTIAVPVGADSAFTELDSGIATDDIEILLVDDVPEVLECFENIMAMYGMKSGVASSGDRALRMMEENGPFKVVYIDWDMPEMNGIELAKAIREKYGDDVVVIMILAVSESEAEAQSRELGIDTFISKPLLTSNVIDGLNRALGMRANREKPALPGDEEPVFPGVRLLVVEDVEINREIMIALLGDSGATIECAENGREAVEAVRDAPGRYDVILMDIHMPEMDGYEATRTIRAIDDKYAKTVPIIAMTANVFTEDIEKCFECGMNDHIGKPIRFDELIRKLKKHISAG